MFTGREDMPVAFDFSHHGHSLVTLYVQFLCSDWSRFDKWVHAKNLCSMHLETCLLWQLKLKECQLVMFLTVFFHWVYKIYVACQSQKSDFGMASFSFFHLAWCVRGLKSLKRFWPYLIVFNVSWMVSLINYCIWCSFFISNLMKSSVVYAAI